MRKKAYAEKRISFKKLQLVKLTNPEKIFGGTKMINLAECTNPENASKPQGVGHSSTQ